VKEDLFRAVQQFYLLNHQRLHFLNQAFVVLIPQKENPQKIIDYRPISLTHSFAKLITKILSNRLGPQLDDLISMNQSALIRKRCLHDNFMFVQQAIRQLHRKKKPNSLHQA
jgi:hypothetical protein